MTTTDATTKCRPAAGKGARLLLAHNRLRAVPPEEMMKQRTLYLGLPVLLRKCGLAATSAFLGTSEEGRGVLVNLEAVLGWPSPPKGSPAAETLVVGELPLPDYLQVSTDAFEAAETLALIAWRMTPIATQHADTAPAPGGSP